MEFLLSELYHEVRRPEQALHFLTLRPGRPVLASGR